MALDHGTIHQKDQTQLTTAATSATATTAYRGPARRRIFLRRRKLPTVRLGGKGSGKRGLLLVRMLRKMKLRWLKLQYLRMLKRLKDSYRELIKDFTEAGATFEAYQQRLLMETSFAVPVMGVSFNNFPSMAVSDLARSAIYLM